LYVTRLKHRKEGERFDHVIAESFDHVIAESFMASQTVLYDRNCTASAPFLQLSTALLPAALLQDALLQAIRFPASSQNFSLNCLRYCVLGAFAGLQKKKTISFIMSGRQSVRPHRAISLAK
jgi:hypothetical protein